MASVKKLTIFLIALFLIIAFFYPKKCDSMYHVLPSEMKEKKGLIDLVCICVGYRVNTFIETGGPSKGLCFGIPVRHCKGYVDGEYKIVRCK